MTDPELDQALDELYDVDPPEFVAVRKRLATNLRSEGRKEAAKEINAARRPSTSAWALNQLARRRPELVEQLRERSRALLDAQNRAIAGERDAMREATLAHRTTLEEATQEALAILGPRSNDAFRSEIVATLRAASTDDEVGRVLQRGRLVREVSSSGGFPDAAELTVIAFPDAADRSRRKAERPKATPEKRSEEPASRQAAEREAQQQLELEARAEAQRRAAAAAAAAAADAELAEERVAQLERDLGEARQNLRDARARSTKAAAEARRTAAPG